MEVVDAHRINLEAVMDAIDMKTFRLMAAVGKIELDNFRERASMGKRGAAKQGRIPTSNIPYGYRTGEDGRPQVVESEAEVVRRVSRMCVRDGMGARSIARQLNPESTDRRREDSGRGQGSYKRDDGCLNSGRLEVGGGLQALLWAPMGPVLAVVSEMAG